MSSDLTDPPILQISDVSRHAGVAISTIRLWEQQKLLKPAYSKGGRRRYRQSDIERAVSIKRMRMIDGMKIPQIRAALAARRKSKQNGEALSKDEEARPEVGAYLRRLRLGRKMTIRAVADAVGIEPSMLASIERTWLGMDIPTLRNLANFYGVSLNQVMGLQPAAPTDREMVFREHGIPLPRLGLGVQMERLCSGGDAMHCSRWRIEPGVNSNGAYRHEGEEFLFVISGEFELTIDNTRVHHLVKGDAMYFKSKLSHAWRNPGKELAEVVWVNVGSDF